MTKFKKNEAYTEYTNIMAKAMRLAPSRKLSPRMLQHWIQPITYMEGSTKSTNKVLLTSREKQRAMQLLVEIVPNDKVMSAKRGYVIWHSKNIGTPDLFFNQMRDEVFRTNVSHEETVIEKSTESKTRVRGGLYLSPVGAFESVDELAEELQISRSSAMRWCKENNEISTRAYNGIEFLNTHFNDSIIGMKAKELGFGFLSPQLIA